MTRRFCSWFAVAMVALAAASLSAPAGAQPPPPDRRAPKRPSNLPAPSRPTHTVPISFRVDGFSPDSGRAGTRVTVEGNGFSRTTQVLVGGRSVKVLSWSPTKIVFAVPDVPGETEIVLRKPGASGELRVGLFRPILDPEIRRFAPASGPSGTRVELFGRGFERDDRLTMDNRPMQVGEWTPERMVVTIPEGTGTDYIVLSRGRVRARSPQRFRVVAEALSIARFSPDSGPPGTRVRITGTGFSPRDRIQYGNITTPVLGRGIGWVDVEVPRRATRSEYFTVRGARGAGRSFVPFTLDLAPVVSKFSPTRGAPGTQVDIRGKNFRDGDWVALAGKRLPIVQLSPGKISVTIPIGSESGRFVVGRRGVEASSAGRFEVLNPPTLTAFTPTRGDPGTRVTLTGSNLAGAEVLYGRTRIPVRSRQGDGALVVEIPRAARDERFHVRTRAGAAQSSQVFQVQYFTVIENARPRSGTPGTTVVLTGRHVDKADDFFIGSRRLELVARDNNSATCKIPDGARTAPLAWTTFGRRSETTWRFDVLTGPQILQFQPTAGPPLTDVIIRGDHIDRRTQAYFGRTKLRVVRVRPPHEITVQLPRDAAGSEYLYLEGHGARARSEQTFEVKVAPIITSFSPAAGRAGLQVLVRGRWFTDATEILIGKVRSRVVRRDSRAGTILIEVPRDLPAGPHVMSAKSEALLSDYRKPFVVLPSASITSISPERARWGQQVRLDGSDLGRSVRIWFGATELPIVRRVPSGRQAWVVIPDSARGTATLEIEDGGARQRSPARLTIEDGAPRPPPRPAPRPPRDHRGEKPGAPK
jgi:hypothetical protein